METEDPYPHELVGDGKVESSGTELKWTALWRNTSINIYVDQAFPLENATGLIGLLQKALRKPLIYVERFILYVSYALMLVQII